MSYEDNFSQRPVWTLFKLAVVAIFALAILGTVAAVVGMVTRPVHMAAGVVNRVMDPDEALGHYKWFHDASASLDLYPEKIKKAAQLEAWAETRAPDRAMARQTELTGLEQTCLGLVGDYNSRAARLDAGFFKNPERWLPIARTGAWAPLPPSYSQNWCDLQETSR
jgi:hypothetical protein